jgi:hypothetical protein
LTEIPFGPTEEFIHPMIVRNVSLRDMHRDEVATHAFPEAVLDTGAKMSTAPIHFLRHLGFPACGQIDYTVPENSISLRTDVFAVRMKIPFLRREVDTKVMGVAHPRDFLLIGRNTLRHLGSVLITDWGNASWWWGAQVTHACFGFPRLRVGLIRPCSRQ